MAHGEFPDYWARISPYATERRKTLFANLIKDTVASFNSLYNKYHAFDEAVLVQLGENRLNSLVYDYFSAVVKCKIENGIAPDGRINFSKMAAIFINLLHAKEDSFLFKFNTNSLHETPYPKILRAMLYYRVACVFGRLPPEFFDSPIGQDLLVAFAREAPPPFFHLSVQLRAIYEAWSPDSDSMLD